MVKTQVNLYFSMKISTKEVKSLAKKVGFDLVGITSPEPISEASEFYKKWLKKGYFADMDYLKKNLQRRTNPIELLPDVKSIICLGINYYTKNNKIEKNGKWGQVARYARGKNYHKVIEKMLKKYIQSLDETMKERSFKDC